MESRKSLDEAIKAGPYRGAEETEECSKESALHNMYDSFLPPRTPAFDVGLKNEELQLMFCFL